MPLSLTDSMRAIAQLFVIGLMVFSGCLKPELAQRTDSQTALSLIEQAKDSLEKDCTAELPTISEDLKRTSLSEQDLAKVEATLQSLGERARECGNYDVLQGKTVGCTPNCDWCPIKWYWCVENAGACAGGDNQSCCKLGACGSKHHCKLVCESSCGCDVPPLPPSSGGGGEDE